MVHLSGRHQAAIDDILMRSLGAGLARRLGPTTSAHHSRRPAGHPGLGPT